jgi:lipopolysaccharide/colanic/teichoic acid biosynthesis glycosyltransferase
MADRATSKSALTSISPRGTLYPAFKRVLDVAMAVFAIVVLAPAFAVIAVAIVIGSGLPVLYRQERVGRNGRRFTMLKFRSMRADADGLIHVTYVQSLLRGEAPSGSGLYKLAADSRITRVGAFLRRTSLDELPQLWNVLAGEMSMVGPRPDVPYSVEAYAPWALRRLVVQPGLTGLWQVSGRSKLSIQDMLRLDVAYVDQCSLKLDIEILLRTIPAVISRNGAV